MKKALVTGAAGFLGSHLCDELLNKKYKVVGVDNFFRGKYENLPIDGNFKFYNIDLARQKDKLINLVKKEKPNVVFHYAAINGTEYFYDIPTKVFDDNINITKNVLLSLKNSTVEKIVYASTSEVYGDNPPLPTPENHFIILNINSDRDSYASSKAIGEFYIKFYCKEYGIEYLILRPFNTYGSRMDNTKYGQVIPEFFRKIKEDTFTIIGDGTQTRSFCHVDDHKTLSVMLSESKIDGVVNIGNDEQISILNLAKKIHEKCDVCFNPVFLPPRDYDTKKRQPNISKIRNTFPKYQFINLNTGLNKMKELYYKK